MFRWPWVLALSAGAGDISGTIARTIVEAYCQAIPEWPAGLDYAALFALYTDEIIEMGPRGWAEAMSLEGWDWTEPRTIPDDLEGTG